MSTHARRGNAFTGEAATEAAVSTSPKGEHSVTGVPGADLKVGPAENDHEFLDQASGAFRNRLVHDEDRAMSLMCDALADTAECTDAVDAP